MSSTIIEESSSPPDIITIHNQLPEYNMSKSKTAYEDFLSAHRIKKGDTGTITNTRIDTFTDNKTNQKRFAGNFQIQGSDYNTFLDLYYKEVILQKKEETLTEIQLKTNKAPLLVDIDFQFDYDLQNRLFKKTDIEDILKVYLNVLQSIHQFSPDDIIEIYVMTKPNINHVEKGDKKYVKDGIHIIIGLQCNHICQQYIRKRVIEYITHNPPPFWANHPTKNTLDAVFDERIPKGDCPWQLYGSKKKNRPEYSKNEVYELTSIYNWNYDMETEDVIQNEIPISEFNLQQNFKKLSARYEHHSPFYANDFFETQIEEFFKEIAIPENKTVKPDDDDDAEQETNNGNKGNIMMTKSIVISDKYFKPEYILDLKSISDLDQFIVDYFIDNESMDVDIKQIIEYTLILPEQYWGNGSYELWIRVGWALYGVSNGLFGVWVKFSSQWGGFVWKDVYDLYDKWKNFRADGLSQRSIIYWAKNDAYEKYMEIKTRYNKGYVEDILARFDSVNDIDFAQMAHKINKDRFVCASPKFKYWYEFKDHRWLLTENGSSLTKFIFDDLRILFQNKTHQVQQSLNALMKTQKGDDDEDGAAEKQIKYLKQQIKNLNLIVKKLGNANDINRIVNLCAIEYYDKEFLNMLDENRDLLCFKNGVVDLAAKKFRDGLPQDYISKCSNVNYIEYGDIPTEDIDTINRFMNQLFPDKELCTYMWEHLASAISGRIHNQTFNYYIGSGSNGKSVLTDLMKECLGDYNCASQISLITEEGPKHGSADSYLAELKGARFVIMQEPSKGKTLKEGLMKQLTSGIDEIKTRALFKDPISYKPHLTLVVCANQYLKIDSQDEGTWRRIRAIPFLSKFCANPDPSNPYEFLVDIDMPNKLKLLADCFLSMLVHKYFETQGVVNECTIVTNKSKEYRVNEDLVSQFIDEMIYLVPPGDINPDNLHILKQSDVIHYFKLFKEMHGDTRKYSNKDIFAIINKKYSANVEYIGKNGKTLQWRHLMIIDND